MMESLQPSRIFSVFRAAGFISNHVPLVLQAKGSDHFVTTAVGKTFHIYNCSKLNLVCVGEIQEENIDLLSSHGDFTLTASKETIRLWNRGTFVKQYDQHNAEIHFMLPFGEHMISGDDENVVKVWNVNSLETYLTLQFSKESFNITTALHPSTYLNKILFGSKEGTMQLWNIKTSKLIYEFGGWSESIITLEQAPAIDIAAIGLQNGKIVLHNLKFDEVLMTFLQEFGPVTAISFRTDNVPIMATGSPAGHVSLWDLEKRKVQGCLRNCHNGSVTGMKFLLNQPIMVTSGQDNSLKLWIFDASDGSGRLFKSRSAHSQPPTFVQFYGPSGHILLSAGLDRSLRYTSTIRDEQSCEMSQGSLLKKSKSLGLRIEDLKLPSITFLDSDPTRSSDWDNIVTCHAGSRIVQTWRLQNRCIGKHTLGKEIERLHKSIATVAKISSCGNFVIIGYSTGHLEKFNMQSGIHRGSFMALKGKAHSKPIKGVVTDSVNLTVVSGCAEGFIKFWGFKSLKLEGCEKMKYPVRQLLLHRESSLMAMALEDFTIKIMDIDTKKIVRNFFGHQHSVTDMAFSPDARWLISSSMDSSIRVWDLPSARLLDCFLVDSPVTSLAFSPTGDFLATCHLDEIGLFLWSNKTLYSDLFLSPLPRDYVPRRAQLPRTVGEDELSPARIEETDSMEVSETTNANLHYDSPEQIIYEIITLSSLPNSRWKNLLDLKLVKERNKPKEPPKKPKSAPFFLPTISGLEPKFDASKKDENVIQSRVLPSSVFLEKSQFQLTIEECYKAKNYYPVMNMLKEMSPSSIDIEFRSVSPDSGGSIELMEMTLHFFKDCLRCGRDYELVQSYIALFSKLHGKQIASEPTLRKLADEILEVEKSTWLRCQELINQSTCLVNYFKSATL